MESEGDNKEGKKYLIVKIDRSRAYKTSINRQDRRVFSFRLRFPITSFTKAASYKSVSVLN